MPSVGCIGNLVK